MNSGGFIPGDSNMPSINRLATAVQVYPVVLAIEEKYYPFIGPLIVFSKLIIKIS